MKSWKAIVFSLVILSLSQFSYFLYWMSNALDLKAGVHLYEPEGFVNHYDHMGKTVRTLIEVLYALYIVISVFAAGMNRWAVFFALILLGSTINQFADRALFNPYEFDRPELYFLLSVFLISIFVARQWNPHLSQPSGRT